MAESAHKNQMTREPYGSLLRWLPLPAAIVTERSPGLLVTAVNDRMAGLLGLPGSELEGQAISALLEAVGWPEGEATLQRSFAEGREVSFSDVRDREGRVWEVCLALKPGAWHSPREALLVFKEETGRAWKHEQMEAAAVKALHQQAWVQMLLDTIPVGVTMAEDPECQRITANRVAARQFETKEGMNIPASGPNGEGPGHRYFQDGRELRAEELPMQVAVMGNRAIEGEEIEVLLSSGRRWVARVSAAPVHDPGGNVVGGIAVTVDITAQKRAEEERERLLEVERAAARDARLLESIQENTQAHLAYLDRDFNFVRVNSAYVQGCGYTRDELIGRNHFDLFPDVENKDIFERVRDTGEPAEFREKPFEFAGQPERGTTYWDWTLTPIKTETAGVEGLVLSLTDVTEQVRARGRLVAAERARAQLAESMVAEVNHRIKNNLAIVAGLLRMQADEKQAEKSTVDAIGDAISRIQTFSVIHDQMSDTGVAKVDLLDAVRRIAGIQRGALAREHIEVEVAGERVLCPGDTAASLCVTLGELLTNAIKHGAAGHDGRMVVRIRVSRHEGKLAISTWNSGNPVPEGFDPAQHDSMGMRLVCGMAAQAGGSFTMRQHEGGTMAEICVPAPPVRDGQER